jgi:spore coat protein U-like protein
VTARWIRYLPLIALSLTAGEVHAALNCKVGVTSMDFGVYSGLAAAPTESTGTVTARCQGGRGIIRFQLSPGHSGDAANRYMMSPTDALRYDICTNPARTQIWGDGNGGTYEVFREQTRRGRQIHTVTAYGRIFTGQGVAPGLYSDDIVVTVIF